MGAYKQGSLPREPNSKANSDLTTTASCNHGSQKERHVWQRCRDRLVSFFQKRKVGPIIDESPRHRSTASRPISGSEALRFTAARHDIEWNRKGNCEPAIVEPSPLDACVKALYAGMTQKLGIRHTCSDLPPVRKLSSTLVSVCLASRPMDRRQTTRHMLRPPDKFFALCWGVAATPLTAQTPGGADFDPACSLLPQFILEDLNSLS